MFRALRIDYAIEGLTFLEAGNDDDGDNFSKKPGENYVHWKI